MIHRDLKPSSVVLEEDGQAKVLNFGQTQIATIPGTEGLMIGTPRYMSPEVLRGQPPDSRSDIFSFGVVLYELIAYRWPFGSTTTLPEAWLALLNELPVPLHDVVPGIDAEPERIVEQSLQKDPALRYQNVSALAQELAGVRGRLRA